MASKKKAKAVDGYKAAHANMKNMTEGQLREAIQAEVDKGDDARHDLLTRLVGRFNRVRGNRCMRDVLGLLSKPKSHPRNAYSILDDQR